MNNKYFTDKEQPITASSILQAAKKAWRINKKQSKITLTDVEKEEVTLLSSLWTSEKQPRKFLRDKNNKHRHDVIRYIAE